MLRPVRREAPSTDGEEQKRFADLARGWNGQPGSLVDEIAALIRVPAELNTADSSFEPAAVSDIGASPN